MQLQNIYVSNQKLSKNVDIFILIKGIKYDYKRIENGPYLF